MRTPLLHIDLNISRCMSCLLHNFADSCFLHSEIYLQLFCAMFSEDRFWNIASTRPSLVQDHLRLVHVQPVQLDAACRIWMWHMWKRPLPCQVCCSLSSVKPAMVQFLILSILSLCLEMLHLRLESDESHGSRKLLILQFMIVLISNFVLCIPYLPEFHEHYKTIADSGAA